MSVADFEKIVGRLPTKIYQQKSTDNYKNQLNKNIAIIGAGIAGCSLAKILSSKGHKISLFDKNDEILSGASGNKSLVTYPNLSAFDSPY